MPDLRSLWTELRRRKVWRTGVVYAAVAWGVLQLADIVWDPLGLPPWTMTLVIVLVMMGFPLVLVLEWVFESTAEGVRRTPPAQEAPAGRSLMSWPVAGGSVLLLLAVSGAWWFTTAGASDREPGSRGGHAAAGDSIQAAAAAGGESALKRLAVLPLANLRSDPELDYLGFALADQIIGAIAYVQHVLVRPSSAIRSYQHGDVDAETAGKQLGVDYVLTGNFLHEDGAVRLNVELVDVSTNELLWREGLEVEFRNAFHLQDLVAEKVVDRLDVSFSPEERARLVTGVPEDPVAYEYYLRALSQPLTAEGVQLAIAMLEESLARDSSYAPAFAELGYRLHQKANYDMTERGRTAAAEAAYRSALSRNDELLGALSNLAALYAETGRAGEAVQLLRRAIRINPNGAPARFYLGYVFRFGGCPDEAVAEMETAVALDPGNPRFRSIGVTYLYSGDLDRALVGFELDPESAWGLSWKGQIYMRMDRPELALRYLDAAIDLEPQTVTGVWATAHKALLTDDRERAVSSLRQLNRSGIFDAEQRYHTTNLYGLLQDADATARGLRQAVEGGFFNYTFMQRDAFLDPVRDDPAVRRVLDEARARQEAFATSYCG